MDIFIIFLIAILYLQVNGLLKNNISYIELPLSVNNEKTFNLSEINYLFENNIKTTLYVSDLNQPVDMFLLSNEFSFFIANIEEIKANGENLNEYKSSKNFYYLSKSSSIKLKEDSHKFYFVLFKRGCLSSEDFMLKSSNENNKIVIKDFEFILASDISKKISGGIGLDFNEYSTDKAKNFVNELYRNNYIENSVWFIIYKNNENINIDIDKNKFIANLYIGQYPHQIFKNNSFLNENKLKFTPTNSAGGQGRWEIHMDNIYFDNENDFGTKTCSFWVDFNGIISSPNYYKKIKEIFFNKHILSGFCNENIFSSNDVKYYYIKCKNNKIISEFPSLKFYNAFFDYTFILDYNDLFYKLENYFIFLIISNQNTDYFQRKWILGQPFLKKYILIFDQNKSKISFYSEKIYNSEKYNNNKTKVTSKIFTIIFIIAIIILSLLIYKKYKKNEHTKLKALELSYETFNTKN